MPNLGNWHNSMRMPRISSLRLLELPMLWARSSLSWMRSSLAWLSVSPQKICWLWIGPTVWKNCNVWGHQKKKKKGESGIRGPLKNQDVSCHFNNDTYSFTFDAGTGTSLMITFSNSFPDTIMNLATETRWYTLWSALLPRSTTPLDHQSQ